VSALVASSASAPNIPGARSHPHALAEISTITTADRPPHRRVIGRLDRPQVVLALSILPYILGTPSIMQIS